jgi:hypothetical protein
VIKITLPIIGDAFGRQGIRSVESLRSAKYLRFLVDRGRSRVHVDDGNTTAMNH